MTETAVTKQPEDTTHTQRAGQRAEDNGPQAEHRSDGTAGTWSPSGAHDGASREADDGPAGEEEGLATMFDRLAEAAAAHDGETAVDGVEEIKLGLAAPERIPGQRLGNG
jgi:hypothetical protein